MKTSELISILQTQQRANGDLDVLFGDAEDLRLPTGKADIHVGPSRKGRALYIVPQKTQLH